MDPHPADHSACSAVNPLRGQLRLTMVKATEKRPDMSALER